MAEAILSAQEVDDFIVLRAVTFSNKIQRVLLRDVLRREKLPLLEWRLLFSIARFGDCHVASIVGRTSLDPAHASRAAAALEKKGLITRNVDPRDNRRRLLELTAAGRALFSRVWSETRGIVGQVTSGLTTAELAEFKRLFDKVNAIAADMLEGGPSAEEDRSAA